METKARVLGYNISKVLTNAELMKISGGSVKWTCQHTQRATGYYPGTPDAVADQVWD